jgi:hypothetical protein
MQMEPAMTDHVNKRREVEPEQEQEDRGTTWALPAILLAVGAIMWASPTRDDRVASNDPVARNLPAQVPAPSTTAPK